MIPKIPKKRNDGKSSFNDLVKYIVGDSHGAERAVYHQTRNMDVAENEIDLAIAEMEGLGIQNVRCKDPVFHFILSYRPHEVPTNQQVDEAVEISLKELGLEKCKAVYGLQNDTGIHHIHVCVCRIDPETERAVSPADGWTKKALLKAARKIEAAQGWEILRNDPFWDVTETGEIVAKGKLPRPDKPNLDSNAQDFEAHTGEKSAQTLAIEKAAPIINAAQSWQELHEKLSEVGMKFERKGSGAVVVVNNEIVKASNVGRDCSLSKLEKRLGEFVERDSADLAGDVAIPQPPEPTKQTETTEKTISAWKRYQIYKKDHSELKEFNNSLFGEHKGQREKLREQHKHERDALYQRRPTWKGHGKELNYERMLLAAQQLRERLLLQKKQKEERAKLPTVPKFLSYRKWLGENQPELISDLRNWRENERKEEELSQTPVLQIYNSEPQSERERTETPLNNFSAYQVWKHRDGETLSYSLKGEKTAFVERKDKITVFQNTESSLLAAIQLAQNKWAVVRIDGTRETLDICVKLAKEYNIKIQVPQKYLETIENERKAKQTPFPHPWRTIEKKESLDNDRGR